MTAKAISLSGRSGETSNCKIDQLLTADVNNVSINAPLTDLVSAQENGSLWDGHVVAYAEDIAGGTDSYSFSGGNTTGSNVIAAAFTVVPEPSSTALLGLGWLGLLLRRRRG